MRQRANDGTKVSEQQVFRALADPTRRAIIELLAERPRSIGDVAGEFDVTRNSVVKHLAILAEGGLVVTEQKGRERINRLAPENLRSAAAWLARFDRFWDEKLDALKEVVEIGRDEK